MKLFEHPTRNLFFTGKGGVGKTSMACATAVQLGRGRIASAVGFDRSGIEPATKSWQRTSPTSRRPSAACPICYAMNIDPDESARQYRERMVGPYRGVLPDAAVASMEEQFSGSCTLEIAAFDEFSTFARRRCGNLSIFDHVIFDTAPTGHTLRLFTLPSAWSGFMETNTTGTSCLGPLAGLQAQQECTNRPSPLVAMRTRPRWCW